MFFPHLSQLEPGAEFVLSRNIDYDRKGFRTQQPDWPEGKGEQRGLGWC